MFEHLLTLIAAALAAGILEDDAAASLTSTVEALGSDETRGTISADALTAADEQLTALFAQVRSGDIEGIAADDLETIRETGDAILALRAENVVRAEQAEARSAELAEIEARLAPAPEVEAEAPAEAVAEVVAEAEAVAAEAAQEPVAAAAPAAAPSLAVLAASQPRGSQPASDARSGLEIIGPNGQVLTSLHELAAATADAFTNARGAHTTHAAGERLGRLRFRHPESRTLRGERADADKLEAVLADATDPSRWDEAVVASGGFCSPAEVDYRVPTVSEADRPVMAGLPSFALPRGSVQVATPPSLADITVNDGSDDPLAAVSVWCNATDVDPGLDTKGVQTIDCSAFQTFEACALVKRLQWGNFGAMAAPENVEAWMTLVMAAHARLGESRLLDQIKAASVARTSAAIFGASRDIAEAVARSAEQVRSLNRMRSDARFRVLLPEWVITMGSVDLLRGLQSDPSFLTDAERIFREALANAGVNVTLYKDTPSTGTSQVLGLGAGPALDPWPAEVQWGLFPEGRFSFGNMETLDLGVYRSPELNDTNDVQNFAETFEVVLDHGQGSALWVTSTVCADGSSAAGTEPVVCA